MAGFMFFLGVIVFLIMEFPAAFFLLIVPIAIVLLISFIKWLKK